MPRLLDLFCGGGGAGVGYRRAGFEVVGVDVRDVGELYPFAFVQADALAMDPGLWGVDAVHASPPCQRWTAYRRRGSGVGEAASDLVAPVRELLRAWGGPYVIENVQGAPLENPVRLCGSSFGLDVRRHRYFESNLELEGTECNHAWQTPRFPPATNRVNLRSTVEIGVWRIPVGVQQRAMGIDWLVGGELSQAVPPAYTGYLGRQILDRIRSA